MKNLAGKELVHRAAEERARAIAGRDPLFAPWVDASLGEPILVRTTTLAPSYWLVPVEAGERALGFVRVSPEGRAIAVGALYRDPAQLESAPSVVTGITAAEARSRGESAAAGTAVGDPVYVHDGPPGREAWMVSVQGRAGDTRTFFINASGLYEHAIES